MDGIRLDLRGFDLCGPRKARRDVWFEPVKSICRKSGNFLFKACVVYRVLLFDEMVGVLQFLTH